MPIYKRENGVYYIDITTQSGQRIRQSSRTKDKNEAQRLHDKLKHELWQQENFNEKPSTQMFQSKTQNSLWEALKLNPKPHTTVG